MSRNENSSLSKEIKRIFISSVSGITTYLFVMLFFSLLVYKETVSIEIAEKYLSKFALIISACVCCISGGGQGRGSVKRNVISASIMLAVIMSVAFCIEHNSDLTAMTISSLFCYTATFLVSIAIMKNSKMHKRRNSRKRNNTNSNRDAGLT